MARQLVQATFASSAGPVNCSFPAPASSSYGITGAAFTFGGGEAPTVPPAISFDAIVPGTPNCTVNAYLSAPCTGTLTFEVADLP
jgi:hypothetical protein